MAQHDQHHRRRTRPRTRRRVARAVARFGFDRRRNLDPVRRRLVRASEMDEDARRSLRRHTGEVRHFNARTLCKIHRVATRVVDVDDDDDVAVVKEATVVRGTKGVIDDEDDADERC